MALCANVRIKKHQKDESENKVDETWETKKLSWAKKGSRVFCGGVYRPLHHALVTQTQLSKNLIRQEKYQCLLLPEVQQETYNASLKCERLLRLRTWCVHCLFFFRCELPQRVSLLCFSLSHHVVADSVKVFPEPPHLQAGPMQLPGPLPICRVLYPTGQLGDPSLGLF